MTHKRTLDQRELRCERDGALGIKTAPAEVNVGRITACSSLLAIIAIKPLPVEEWVFSHINVLKALEY